MIRAWIIVGMLASLLFVARAHAATVLDAEGGVDTDADGLTDTDERGLYATDPLMADTDSDSFSDGDEIKNGYSPHTGERVTLMDADTDKDYLSDAWEMLLGTGLSNPDSDGDKYLDGTEVAASYDPLNPERIQVEKRIEVSLGSQTLSYFFGDTLLGSFPISSGLSGTPTPRGEFSVLAKMPVKYYGGPGYSFPNTKWNLHFTTGKARYFIHGAYWHNDFGKPKSHGCVNVSYKNMEPLYAWAQIGTRILIK